MISIITAAFNASSTLQEAINSVLAQTFRDWEMLIVDDGSTDTTARIAFNASQADRRIKCVTQNNKGVASARNLALDTCSHPLVAFLDADDLWLPEKLEKQIEFMRLTHTGFSFTAYRKFSGAKLGPKIEVPPFVLYSDLLKTRPIMCSSVIINRELVDVRMPDAAHEDLAAWLRILRKPYTARGLNEDLLRLRKGMSSRSSNKGRAALNVWRVYRGEEHLNIPAAAWYFTRYAINSVATRVHHKATGV